MHTAAEAVVAVVVVVGPSNHGKRGQIGKSGTARKSIKKLESSGNMETERWNIEEFREKQNIAQK